MSSSRLTQYEDLSPSQQEVVDAWGRGLAVLAGAGSGKTTTLVIKCQALLQRKPTARFAAVSFTERSASDLREKLSQRLSLGGEGGALSGHWVMTIHGLCGAIIQEYPREAGFDGEETMLSESDARLLWERATEGLWYEELPEELSQALDRLLKRESRADVLKLLERARELASFGGLRFLAESPDGDACALGVVAKAVLEKYDRLKRRRGGLDFNDLERGADRALEHPAIREAFQKRFDLVLVDEFQDTNPLQASIMLRFCRPDYSNLCVVGDPKQSIYRFRDADVSVFEEFCNRLPLKRSLNWNFRSRPGIIEFTNRVCAPLFEASGMVYEPLEARRAAADDHEAVVRLDVKDPAELGPWIRGENARGIPLHEMSLLLRRVRGNEKWLKALTAAGIPIAVGSGGLFWEDPRVRELVAFLKWWDQPANALSGAVFLRAPWVGVADAWVDEWVRRDPTFTESFFGPEHLASGVPSAMLAGALAPLRGMLLRPGELLMALLVSDEIEAEIGSAALGLWHRLEDWSMRGLDFHGAVLEAARAMEESRRERDVPPPRNQGQLSILTFHASKGLEFPHVILIDFGKKPRAMPGPMLYWDRLQGTYLVQRDEDGDRDKKEPSFGAWERRERDRNLAESKRIFYVALTRARERLVLVCPELDEKAMEGVRDAEKTLTADHWRGWLESAGGSFPQAVRHPSGALHASAAVCAELVRGARAAVPQFRPRHSVTEWNLLSRCPRAYEWTYIRPVKPDQDADSTRFEELAEKASVQSVSGISQRELGSEVHRALETGDEELLRELEKRAAQSAGGVRRFSAEHVIQWANASPWMGPRLRGAWSELAFEVPVEGEVLVGSMDRLARAGGGEVGLLDFKVTSRRRPAEELREAYATQMLLYAWALQALDGELGAELRELKLINFTPEGVTEVSVVPDPAIAVLLARQARAIVDGAPGEAKAGAVCHHCQFRSRCRANG